MNLLSMVLFLLVTKMVLLDLNYDHVNHANHVQNVLLIDGPVMMVVRIWVWMGVTMSQ